MSTDLLEEPEPKLESELSAPGDTSKQSSPPPPRSTVRESPVGSREAAWRADDGSDDDEPGFFRRNRILLPVAVLGVSGIGYFLSGISWSSTQAPIRKTAVPITIQLPPPPPPVTPPPPPPPPKIEQPREEEMELQPEVVEEAPPEPEMADSPPPIGTNNVGDGAPDSFNLGKAMAGSGGGWGRRLGGSGGGSKWGNYALQVQNTISAAMRRNSKTRSANLSVTARIWADRTGRVTRATLGGTSGDPAVDKALREEVFAGLQLESPPPPGMKMPINLRLTARNAL